MASSQRNQATERSSREEKEGPYTSQDMLVLQILCHLFLDDKITKLLEFLLRKYQKKEQITMEEMLHIVDHEYHEYFSVIFREVCEYMCLGFGIDVREVDPPGHKYVFVPILGLTYSGIPGGDDKIIPQLILLIVMLTFIFLKGNHVSEEDVMELLRTKEMLPKREHSDIGEVWKFIVEDLVREQYLEYRRVPNSDPAHYEFIWGPRTHAETSKMKVLEHLAKINRRDPRSYPHLYEDALKEEQKATHV
ncbi:melanoma-associated antigen 8-like [Octodon degus]|uniref:Melanoma-associated antigen 8-like n=1 Tax=Octodon degus TaxID=10160 RepID=A0A6P3FRB5_OCTDE|nr:melanoma-associated antigen 8-like [Octodon degus]